MSLEIRPALTHELKTWSRYYGEIHIGRKTFDARLNDRDYQTGDTLHLREWDPDKADTEKARLLLDGWAHEAACHEADAAGYTGRSREFSIGYILYGGDTAIVGMEAAHAGVSAGYVVLSLLPTPKQAKAQNEAWDRARDRIRAEQGLPLLGERYADSVE